MIKRRKFFKTSGAAAPGSFLLSKSNASFFKNEMHLAGLQLFTFFGVIDEDYKAL